MVVLPVCSLSSSVLDPSNQDPVFCKRIVYIMLACIQYFVVSVHGGFTSYNEKYVFPYHCQEVALFDNTGDL